MYFIQHCIICRPSDSTVAEGAGIESRTVATSALTIRRSNHSARSHPRDRKIHRCFKSVLWIRNDFFRIRILLFSWSRIPIPILFRILHKFVLICLTNFFTIIFLPCKCAMLLIMRDISCLRECSFGKKGIYSLN
jgi:hypothetical protein